MCCLLVHQSDTSGHSVWPCQRLCGHPSASSVLALAEKEFLILRPQTNNADSSCCEDTAVSKSGPSLITAN